MYEDVKRIIDAIPARVDPAGVAGCPAIFLEPEVAFNCGKYQPLLLARCHRLAALVLDQSVGAGWQVNVYVSMRSAVYIDPCEGGGFEEACEALRDALKAEEAQRGQNVENRPVSGGLGQVPGAEVRVAPAKRPVGADANVPNLSDATDAELDAFLHKVTLGTGVLRQRPTTAARLLFPGGGRDTLRATRLLYHYAVNRRTARSLRGDGKVIAAKKYEDICDGIYESLPPFARTW